MITDLARAQAVKSVVQTTALRCGLTPAVQREVIRYAVAKLARGATAHRAIKAGQLYARVRAGDAVYPKGVA